MSKYNFHLPNKPATKSGSILSYDYSDNRTFIPQPLTFSRGSNATYIDKDGLIKSTTGDLPRINRQDGSLLLEPSSTNLIGDSEDFSQSSWAKSNVQVQNGFSSPDGLNNAYKVTKTDSNSMLYFNYNPNRLTDSRSIWAKTTSGTGQVHLCAYHSNANSLFTITEDWQRFDLTGYVSTGGNAFYAVDFRGSSTLSEVILWGVQAEDNSFATSYIPTTGAAATRLVETAINAGTENVFNSEEGVLYAEFKCFNNLSSEFTRVINLNDGSSGDDNSVKLLRSNSVSDRFFVQIEISNTIVVGQNITLSDSTEFNKIAISYKSGDTKIFVNGISVATRTETFTLPTLNQLDLSSSTGFNSFQGNVKELKVFNKALTDTELQQLTTQ